MFSFLLPKPIRQGRNLLKDATKLLAYKRDLWSEATVADYEIHLKKLEAALRERDVRAVEEHASQLDAICTANLPPVRDAGMRENVEVFLVAIVVALGVRTYFLQPFTIPTGSMQPTLNGVIGHPTTEPAPNIATRLLQKAVLGRTYFNIVAREECTLLNVREFNSLLPFIDRTPFLSFGFFTRTEIETDHGNYVVQGMRDTVSNHFLRPAGKMLGSSFKAGEPIVRGYIDTGDHVFVDKCSYHFRKPRNAEVFVFNTLNIPTRENQEHPGGPSQFYIKRLGGIPGDELRIAPPDLFINGQRAAAPAYRRVMEDPHYRGYSNGPEGSRFTILGEPDIPFTVPAKNYFALGDNSFHSSDSRDWGPLPEQNIMGRGVFVYWPFGSHWGLIH